MKHVECMGAIWALRDYAYKRLLKDIKEGKTNIDLNDYGKVVITDPVNLTDLQNDPEMFE